MLRKYPAFAPMLCNWVVDVFIAHRLPRGFPVLRPIVSSNAYTGSGRPIAGVGQIVVEHLFLKGVDNPTFHFVLGSHYPNSHRMQFAITHCIGCPAASTPLPVIHG